MITTTPLHTMYTNIKNATLQGQEILTVIFYCSLALLMKSEVVYALSTYAKSWINRKIQYQFLHSWLLQLRHSCIFTLPFVAVTNTSTKTEAAQATIGPRARSIHHRCNSIEEDPS